jgi:serine phosphatase RsbU (regulator of sigma subunit)
MPVGKGEKTESFTLRKIDLQKGDSLYLYTDGYADQFGGPKGKKFKYKALNDLLLSNSTKSMEYQKEHLNSTIETWRGNLEQVDDILVVGIKLDFL